MQTERLIEPQGLLYGADAAAAVRNGAALSLAGGDAAFTLGCLIDGPVKTGPFPVDRIPASWLPVLERLTRPFPAAGLPHWRMVMGILNVTPDSFSDGGQHHAAADAVQHGLAMLRAGTDVLDIGAESTRPHAVPVSSAEEWDRLTPVLDGLRGKGGLISVDTRNAATMAKALAAGATLINDVSALTYDRDALGVMAAHDCPVVLMHMRGTPETMNSLTDYHDVAADVVRELARRIEEACAAGIARERILIDPGVGFAKTTEQNAELLRRLPLLANLGCRIVLGVSRKRFLGALSGQEEARLRDPGTLVASAAGCSLPGTLLRVHDYAGMIQALRVWEGCYVR